VTDATLEDMTKKKDKPVPSAEQLAAQEVVRRAGGAMCCIAELPHSAAAWRRVLVRQDPVTSRARQLAQAVMLTARYGRIVAEFFDVGESRTLTWARRPQPAALVAALADPDRGWTRS
jgi:hypothetical protein